MTGKVVLLGATGYTGARVAQSLVARGAAPVLAGRSPEKLAALSGRLGGLPTAVADVGDPASVRALLDAGDVLVSTVGPFTRLGGPAVDAAVAAGAVYLDSTGEPPFVRRVFEQYGPAAERSGAALLTAFGNDYLPGVLAGALAVREARGAGTPARVDVGYFISTERSAGGTRMGAARAGQPFSRGTLNSLVGVAAEPVHTWRDGELRSEAAGVRMRTFDVRGRPRPGVTIGGSEQFALPRFEPGLQVVDVYLGWFGPASGAVHAASGLTPWLSRIPALGRAVTGLAGLAAGRASEAPDPDNLARSTSHFVAEVFDDAGTLLARTRLVAPDAYAITADLLAWGATRAAGHGVHGTGALDPVGAFGLDELSAGAASAGIVPAPDGAGPDNGSDSGAAAGATGR
ncbi:trans-acting enoyl reductase family protein [Pseudonocardia sp. KRD291]|uniref:saccharopine dehydrogenase family protein n=1 Tax=Pseudonocardia sp. KRD291 TaxID=2792007 RepID=UPI001C49D122|nr:NAD(P)H-binding protein [Pseudonocardia sp. KRD291]MBW0106658.1 NAD(P)H-binding protein [Pseudonocardia sp. KRD291]